jgi:BirA family biotin operon repressor/biotin-[acetyl-CoA-carboxylase] ligase
LTSFLARHEWFDRVGSTNDVVRDWLAGGAPEVCLAVAGEQVVGRGRAGRTWTAPPGAALLLSVGFRPTWLAPDRVWQLAAIVSLAMASAAESITGLADGTVRLKWPNDLVLEDGPGVRKLAGVLGETQDLGTPDPRAVVGIGVNVDWPATDFPVGLAQAMTSLRQAAADRPVDRDALLSAFLARLEPAVDELRAGRFPGDAWASRQATTGRAVRLERPDGHETVRALGVDSATGALVVANPDAPGDAHQVLVGEVTHVRLGDPLPVEV